MKGKGIMTGLFLTIAALAAASFVFVAASSAAPSANVALGKGVTASTNSFSGNPSMIVDGNYGAAWYSYQIGSFNDQGFVLDLGATYAIDKINIYAYQAWGVAVSASGDGSEYEEIYNGVSSGSPSNPEDYDYNGLLTIKKGAPFEARYIQYYAYANWNQYVGISEIEVFEHQPPDVELNLTYPVGESPKVFTQGWTFGASCILTPSEGEPVDISDQVRWSGTGSFVPSTGSRSMPAFAAPGTNTITLTVKVEGEEFSKSVAVEAVSPSGYARLWDEAFCPADGHGSPICPKSVLGPIISGSPTVAINGKPAACSGDAGIHVICAGPNVFEIMGGDAEVLIDGRPAARRGEPTKHCGGFGRIITEAPRKIVKAAGDGALTGTVTNAAADPIAGLAVWVYPEGSQDILWAETDETGRYAVAGIAPGKAKVLFSNRIRDDSGVLPAWADSSYESEWFDGALTYADATEVTIIADSTTTADAQLASGGGISGRILDGNGAGIKKAMVTAYGTATKTTLWHWTDDAGAYALLGLPADTYKVFVRGSLLGYRDAWFGGTEETASPVSVGGGQQVPDVDISLAAGGGIVGRVTNQSKPVPGVPVQAINLETNLGGVAVTDDNGMYAIAGLPDGVYKIRFLGEAQGLTDMWHPNALSWDEAAQVAILGAATVEGIDGRLLTIELADSIKALQILSGMNSDIGFTLEDANGDGEIGLAEAVLLLRKVAGLN